MNVTLECFLALLKSNGIEEDYIDVHEIGSVTYYFDGITLKFANGCIPQSILRKYLKRFGLGNLISQIQTQECACDW